MIYVGTGEGQQRPDLATGDGIYKSIDAGKTWAHLGLRDTQQISQIIVDPKNPEPTVRRGARPSCTAPTPERGIFRSTDGGESFQKVLYKDENTGGVGRGARSEEPEHRLRRAVGGAAGSVGERRLPRAGQRPVQVDRRRHDLAAADQGLADVGGDRPRAHRHHRRADAAVADVRHRRARRRPGIYRSDDAGESWSTRERRSARRRAPATPPKCSVHPTNPDIVYVPTIVAWKSTDGGKTFTAFRGAPGGDDYQKIWINPTHARHHDHGPDQGAVVTVNGGEIVEQLVQPADGRVVSRHRPTTRSRIASAAGSRRAARRASRAAATTVRSRSATGIRWASRNTATSRPIRSIPTSSTAARSSRYDRRTGQVQNVGAEPLRGAANYRVAAHDAGAVLTGRIRASSTSRPTSCGRRRPAARAGSRSAPTSRAPTGRFRRTSASTSAASPRARPSAASIYTIAPSYVDENTIWAGTDDGSIHVTRDGGKTWTDVTPPALTPWAKVSIMDASPFRRGHGLRRDQHLPARRSASAHLPHARRRQDVDRTSRTGIPDGGIINVVREDPKRRGLLFAGIEQAVYVSFDDGDHWQSLRLNMPATSIRDLVIKDDDLVVGTHGRSFWILDDITPLRADQGGDAAADVHLFQPQQAWRFRWNKNTDTPLPPDEPAGQNPAGRRDHQLLA